MKKNNLKKLTKVLTPKERAKLTACYYQQSEKTGKDYKQDIQQITLGMSCSERVEYSFYLEIIREVYFTLGPDFQTMYLRLVICNKNLLLILASLLLLDHVDAKERPDFEKRLEKLVSEIKSLYIRLVSYIDGIEKLEERYFDGDEIVNRSTWMARYAKEEFAEIQEFVETLVVFPLIKGQWVVSLNGDFEVNSDLSELVQDKTVDRAASASGYRL